MHVGFGQKIYWWKLGCKEDVVDNLSQLHEIQSDIDVVFQFLVRAVHRVAHGDALGL